AHDADHRAPPLDGDPRRRDPGARAGQRRRARHARLAARRGRPLCRDVAAPAGGRARGGVGSGRRLTICRPAPIVADRLPLDPNGRAETRQFLSGAYFPRRRRAPLRALGLSHKCAGNQRLSGPAGMARLLRARGQVRPNGAFLAKEFRVQDFFRRSVAPYLRTPVAGVTLSLLFMLGAVALGTHSLLAFFSIEGLAIVVGGVLAVAFMSFEAEDVRKALKVIAEMFRKPAAAPPD